MLKLEKLNVVKNFLVFVRNYWVVLAILVLGLTPLLWFKPGFIVARGDYFPFVNPMANSRFMYMWSDAAALGSIPQAGNPSPMQSIWFGIWYVLASIGLSIGAIQIILEVIYFLGAGLSMYLLASTVYRQGKLTPFVASIFYMFNFIMFFRNFNDVASWFLLLIPLLIVFYIRIIRNIRQNRKNISNIVVFSTISAVLLSFSVTNPAFTILTVAVILILFLYSVISEKGLRLKVCKTLGCLSSVILLFNIWWIIPFLIESISYAGGSIQLGTTTEVTSWLFVYSRSSFLNLFWLNGIWNWTPEYFSYINAYSNSILQILVFIPMLLAFSALLFSRRYRKINLCFAITMIILMFLAKGLHSPQGDINLFLYDHIPGAFIFREPFLKLYYLLIIPMALLIGFSTTSIVQKIKLSSIPYKKTVSIIFILIIVSSFIVSVFPVFNSNALFSKTESLPFSSYVQIPFFWYQASNYINSIPGNFRVLQTPGDDFYQVPYVWGYYGTDAVASSLITKPVVQNSVSYASVNDMTSLIYQEIDANKSVDFVNTISLLNIKYIIQRNDVWWNYTGRTMDSPEYMKSFLANTSGIKIVASFGPLDIYEVSDNKSLSRIYPTESSVFINGSINDFAQILSNGSTSINSAFFLTDELSESQSQFIIGLPNTQIYDRNSENLTPENGTAVPFDWKDLTYGSIQIKYFSGWKNIVMTDGKEEQDTLSFPSLNSCPYKFSSAYNGTGWAGLNSTLVYVKTGNEPITIDEILSSGQPITDIIGVWWQSDWEGMGTKPLLFPITIPANQEAIIQLNHIITDDITIVKNTISNNATVIDQNLPRSTFEMINPTKAIITIQNATQPFFIVFGENYNPQWKAYVSNYHSELNDIVTSNGNEQESSSENSFTVQDISYLFSQPISNQYHFITNGYANAWYFDPQELHEGASFTITLFFVPQAYYYVGIVVTMITIVAAVSYLLFVLVIKLRRKVNIMWKT